jgi:hypothetical protein
MCVKIKGHFFLFFTANKLAQTNLGIDFIQQLQLQLVCLAILASRALKQKTLFPKLDFFLLDAGNVQSDPNLRAVLRPFEQGKVSVRFTHANTRTRTHNKLINFGFEGKCCAKIFPSMKAIELMKNKLTRSDLQQPKLMMKVQWLQTTTEQAACVEVGDVSFGVLES